MDNGLVLGVDGGGTKSTLVVARRDGALLAKALGGGLNYHLIGVEEARRNLSDLIGEGLKRAGAAAYDRVAVGLSALDGPATAETLKWFAGSALESEKLRLDSDVYMALMGATLGEPGVMVVSGTGAMLIAKDREGRIRTRGGWGYLLGDPGSSYGIAFSGLRAAIRAFEGIGPEGELARRARRFFNLREDRALIERLYLPAPRPDDMAQFAREVLAAARAGDAEAERILAENLDYLLENAARLVEECGGACRVGLYGGLFQYNDWVRARFVAALKARTPGALAGEPEFPPEVGAVISVLQREGAWSAETLKRMRAGKAALYGEERAV